MHFVCIRFHQDCAIPARPLIDGKPALMMYYAAFKKQVFVARTD